MPDTRNDERPAMRGMVCRQRAFEALYIAQFQTSRTDQAIVLDVVGQWNKMAEQLERVGRG
ncbi:MAG: hypothetical protein WDO24_07420 [Pseudomonadota bacterium]